MGNGRRGHALARRARTSHRGLGEARGTGIGEDRRGDAGRPVVSHRQRVDVGGEPGVDTRHAIALGDDEIGHRVHRVGVGAATGVGAGIEASGDAATGYAT